MTGRDKVLHYLQYNNKELINILSVSGKCPKDIGLRNFCECSRCLNCWELALKQDIKK